MKTKPKSPDNFADLYEYIATMLASQHRIELKLGTLKTHQLKIEASIADLHSRVNNCVNLLHTFVRENPASLIANKSEEFRVIKDDGKLKTSELLAECKKLFPVSSYWSDEKLDTYFPAPKEPTTHKFHNVQEADERWKNKSADDLDKLGVKGITLRDRLLFELAYFKETGNHLDVESITLCSGSRDPDGDVPCVDWRGGRLYVYWYDPTCAYGTLRSREQFEA